MLEAAGPAALEEIVQQRYARPGRPQVFGSAETGYFTLGEGGAPQKLIGGIGRAPSTEPLVEVYDPNTGLTTYQPRSAAVGMQVPPAAAAGGGTVLIRNVPFVANALGISQEEATRMLLTPTGGRKSPEQIETEFAKSMLNNPIFAAHPERAAKAARELRQALEGTLPEAPAETPTASAFSVLNPSTWLGGAPVGMAARASPCRCRQMPQS